MKLHPQLNIYNDSLDFWLVDERDGKRRIALPVTFDEGERDGLLVEPTFCISMSDGQELFERLWGQGFRSKHDKGNAESLDAARREHIGDLRKAAKLS